MWIYFWQQSSSIYAAAVIVFHLDVCSGVSIRLYKHKKHFKDFNDFEKRMNTRSRLVVPCDAFHIPRTSIKSQTSKSPVSHLAQDQNYQMNYCLFTYKDQIFKQTSRINEIRTRYNNKSKLIKKKNRTLNFS